MLNGGTGTTTSTGSGSVVLATSPTITTPTITSATVGTAAAAFTNSAAGTPFLASNFAATTTAGQYTYERFGVNSTLGNYLENRFNYTASASISNNYDFRITANSIFAISNNDATPFTFTNPSGPVSIGTGGFTSGGNSSVTGTLTVNMAPQNSTSTLACTNGGGLGITSATGGPYTAALALASTGAYSTSAVQGDLVLVHSSARSIHLQVAGGASAMSINPSNQITIRQPLTLTTALSAANGGTGNFVHSLRSVTT